MAKITETIQIEKYKILWTAFENEMGRFWQRYNILISIQLIAASLFKLTEKTKSTIEATKLTEAANQLLEGAKSTEISLNLTEAAVNLSEVATSLIETSNVNSYLQISMFFVLSLFSLITTLIVGRAIDVYKLNLRMIKEFEETYSDFVLLTKQSPNDVSVMEPKAYNYAMFLARFLLAIWLFIMIYKIFEVLNILHS